MFEDFYERYEDEEHEAIVLIENVLGAGKCNNYWSMTATTLGMVFCENAKKDFRKGRLEWPVTDEERNSEKGWNRLRKGQICRIKVRKLCEKQLPQAVKAEEINAWCLTEVLELKTECLTLEQLWAEYIKPIEIKNDVLGILTLNKELDMFEGKITLDEEEILLYLEVDAQDCSSWNSAAANAAAFVSDWENKDRQMRAFAAGKLTELANEWQEDDDNAGDITEDIFAERISVSELSFTSDGDFTAYYNDDDMFWGHAVEICGNMENGFESANIAG